MAPRILVFGTGSIGAVYTWVLSRALPPSNIVAICRSNYDEASKNGLTVHSSLWGKNLNVKPAVFRSVPEAAEASPGEPFDYVIISSKALQTTPSTAELIKPAVSKTTTIVLIQNGIGIEDEYAKMFPDNPLLSTVVYLPATQVSPGVVEHKEVELLHVGTYPANASHPAKDSAKLFVDLLGSAGASAKLHDDVQGERWTKLLVNTSWNPICALSRLRDRQLIDVNEDVLPFIKDAMMEVASVAQAYGYKEINEELVDFQIGRASVRSLPGVQPSMLADALAAKNMEVEAIVGNVVKFAKEKGIKVPILRTIYLLASGLDRSFTIGKP
ncbi:putative 2-dehydropantoate 2-reductase [Seiridium cardinale]|uniref:2-dehydropantoate 2-reductase n=1 Tax=Seiridium cardinale TaxID=138064 RepID=A0ABR2Y3K9_9PEZI